MHPPDPPLHTTRECAGPPPETPRTIRSLRWEVTVAQRIVPMLAYEDGVAAIEFLIRAFGFVEDESQRYTNGDGTVGHAR